MASSVARSSSDFSGTGDSAEKYELLNEESQKQQRRKHSIVPWVIHAFFFALYVVILPIVASRYPWKQQRCVDKLNSYSPINEGIKEEYVDYWFKGSLWYDSPYKGPPTPAVNKAWKDVLKYGAINVSAEDITRIGHNLTAVQFPEDVADGYLAVAVGTHQLHCLHYLWQDHHMSYFPETIANKEGVPEMYERHYEHCVDYIRQGIMCNFDPGIIPYYWVRDHNQPTPDGNTFHKCVNWEHLEGWLADHAVEMPEGFEWHQPPDAVSLPKNP
jgi:hypothetical protein